MHLSLQLTEPGTKEHHTIGTYRNKFALVQIKFSSRLIVTGIGYECTHCFLLDNILPDRDRTDNGMQSAL